MWRDLVPRFKVWRDLVLPSLALKMVGRGCVTWQGTASSLQELRAALADFRKRETSVVQLQETESDQHPTEHETNFPPSIQMRAHQVNPAESTQTFSPQNCDLINKFVLF